MSVIIFFFFKEGYAYLIIIKFYSNNHGRHSRRGVNIIIIIAIYGSNGACLETRIHIKSNGMGSVNMQKNAAVA